MIPYPSIDPVIVRIGPIAIRWYGLMYLLGFTASYVLVRHRVRKKTLALSRDFLDSFYTLLIVGLIIGARLGYAVFYNWSYYWEHPLQIFALWQGGLSFHGGLIGSTIAGWWYSKRSRVDPWLMADLIALTAPIGIGLGRLGNFINGELYGRVTSAPWAVVFPEGGPLPRHPSQIYEFLLEGILLFIVLWCLKDRVRKSGLLVSLFVALYGLFRFIAEFFRQPDPQLGFIAGPFTMGQVLSAFMLIVGVALYIFRRRS